MKIIKSVFTPKKKPATAVTEIKSNVLRIDKEEFEVPAMDKMAKERLKRKRDISLIEPEEKTPVKKTAVKPAEVKTKINADPEKLKNNSVVKPESTRLTARSSVKAAEVKTKISPKTEPVMASKHAVVKTEIESKEHPTSTTSTTNTRRSSRLSSPVKTESKVLKLPANNSETLRKSKRSTVTKLDRYSLMVESSDEEKADEAFDISEVSEASEDADELEMIEISENDEEIEDFSDDGDIKKKKKTRQVSKKKSKTPMMTKKKDASRWERIKKVLESGGTVEALPGRVDEFDWIKRTVTGLLESSLGGCLYISGVPGTGKTATTHRTLDALSLAALKGECCDFDFVEINGMRLSDPGQAYSILAKTIFKGQKRVPSSGALALQKLEAHFKTQQKSKTPGRPCVVLLDELDLLLRKKQSILYHFFEWPNWANSQLIVITIANTMDLPERFLSNRISSRLGLTRYNFKPYDHAALANIIEHQLKDYVQYLGKDAIQLCARKVSAVSGDARRAVNLAKRAVDYFRSCTQEELVARMTGRIVEKVAEGSEMMAVNLRLMDIVLKDALMANPVEVIGQLAKHQRILLLSIVLARKRCEEENSLKGGTKIIGSSKSYAVLTINRVLDQHFQLCRTHQYHPLPSLQELHCLLESLESLRLLRCVKFRECGPEGLVQLLVHEEDIRKGLGDDQALKKYIRD